MIVVTVVIIAGPFDVSGRSCHVSGSRQAWTIRAHCADPPAHSGRLGLLRMSALTQPQHQETSHLQRASQVCLVSRLFFSILSFTPGASKHISYTIS